MVLLFSPGQNLQKLLGKEKFRDQKVTGSSDQFDGQRVKVIDELIGAINKRFDDLDQGVLQASKLADLTTWPSELNDETKGGQYC